MNALLQQFLQESREALESIGSTLLAMERNPTNSSLMVELFRLVHTLKGNSGLFEFPALTQVLHAAEDVMDAVRGHSLAFSQPLADQLLETADYVARFLDHIEAEGEPGEEFQAPPVALITSLRARLTPAEIRPLAPAMTALATPEHTRSWPAEYDAAICEALNEGQTVFWITYVPSSDCFFQGTDPFHLARQLLQVLWQEVTAVEPWPPAAELDAYRCNLRFSALAVAEEKWLDEHFRYVREQVSWRAILRHDIDSAQAPIAAVNGGLPLDALAAEILGIQHLALATCAGQSWRSGQQTAIVRTINNVLQALPCPARQLSFAGTCAEADQKESAAPLLAWLAQELQLAAEAGRPVTEERALGSGTTQSQAADSGTESSDANITKPTEEGTGSVTPRVLKVEQEKIDRLMNLIGEIVVAKNSLPYLAERAEKHYQQRELAREIKAQYAVVNRIADDLQDVIMQVRMMPMSFVLQRFPRLVRDIARKLDKKVQLVLEGEDTEADKSMIEALADPLMHIVRNALDHGLESPAARVATGKPETGTLSIRATQNADRVLIVIEDDGRGIDPERIKAKVAEKGLVDAKALDDMNDQELINLVFLPGFSTAEQVSNLSGRGVGMDVVRSGIEKVGGHLRLASQPGKGTQLSLSLPLSMAVTQVMVIESAVQRFGIPMDQVMETVRLPSSAINTIKHQPTAQLRGRTIPLKSLNQLLAVPNEQVRNEDGEYALLVLRSRNELVGLLIDDFHGSVDIILKPMIGILAEMPGYAGTAVMGDGSILMILNPTELFE